MNNKYQYQFSFYLLLFINITVFGQSQTIDSLRNVLQGIKLDTVKVNRYNALANEFRESNPDSTIFYGLKAFRLSKKLKYDFGEANAFMNQGNGNIILSNYKLALKDFEQAQAKFENLLNNNSSIPITQIKNGLARAYASSGVVYSEVNNYSIALEYYSKALKIYHEIDQKSSISKAYNNIGIVYKSQKNLSKALEYFKKALVIQNEIVEPRIGITLNNIGAVYFELGNKKLAFTYYSKAQKVFDKDSSQRNNALLQTYWGDYYKSEEPIKALIYYQKSQQLYEALDNKFGVSLVFFSIGQFYFDQKKYKEALEYTHKSLVISKEIGVFDQIIHSEKLLSDIYIALNNPTASLKHYKDYIIAKDKLNNEEYNKKILRAEIQYEYQTKEALLVEQNKRQQQLLLFSVIGGLLLLGLIFVIYNRFQIKRRLTLQKEVAEYEQKALHLQMNPHFVFNCLGSISSFIVQNGADSAIKYLSKFSKLMRLTLEYSKGKLIPIGAEIESLQNYLELEQLRFNNKFEFSIHSSSSLEDDMALPPLLVQPFVENAILHGIVPKEGNGLIEINFNVISNQLICTITDDGIGINQSKSNKENSVKAHQSMALEITKKRLEMIETTSMQKAHVTIDEIVSLDNQIIGTKVIITLPVQYLSETAKKI